MKFQDDISMPHTYMHTHTYVRTSRNNMLPNFEKVGSIKNGVQGCLITRTCEHDECPAGLLVSKYFYGHSYTSFICQLMAKEWTLCTGKLPRDLYRNIRFNNPQTNHMLYIRGGYQKVRALMP